jgi:hypothetical protein
MSKLICGSAIDGAIEWVARADAAVARAVEAHGEEQAVGFPSTAYHLPIIYSLSDYRVKTLADCPNAPRRTTGCPTSAAHSMPESPPCSRARSSRRASTSAARTVTTRSTGSGSVPRRT